MKYADIFVIILFCTSGMNYHAFSMEELKDTQMSTTAKEPDVPVVETALRVMKHVLSYPTPRDPSSFIKNIMVRNGVFSQLCYAALVQQNDVAATTLYELCQQGFVHYDNNFLDTLKKLGSPTLISIQSQQFVADIIDQFKLEKKVIDHFNNARLFLISPCVFFKEKRIKRATSLPIISTTYL